MSGLRVASAFETARTEGRSALVGYLPAAFPDVEGSIAALRTMVDAGCDVIEVGLPYSDPVMDGPVIQRAVQHALDGGFRVDDLFRVVEAVAATDTPTLVMTSWNPVASSVPSQSPSSSMMCSTSRCLSFVLSRELTLGMWMMVFSAGSSTSRMLSEYGPE